MFINLFCKFFLNINFNYKLLLFAELARNICSWNFNSNFDLSPINKQKRKKDQKFKKTVNLNFFLNKSLKGKNFFKNLYR